MEIFMRHSNKYRIAILYYMWPHYRKALMKNLDCSEQFDFVFYGSGNSFQGIKHVDVHSVKRFEVFPFVHFAGKMWQSAGIKVAMSRKYDALIYLGDPNVISTWIGSALARLRGIPVIFWGHGWIRPEGRIKSALRKIFYSLSDHFLVYSDRAKLLGREAGMNINRISIVYNSLDLAAADNIIKRIENGTLHNKHPNMLFSDKNRPLLICSARLTQLCRFDILLEAAALMSTRGRKVNILLIGDGPQRQFLQEMAEKLGLDVYFYGSCYDEAVIGQIIYWSDLTVSPGKIGLTAIHSLMYGTPVITHGDMEWQMPEAEAINPGCSGDFFVRNDAESLADAISGWLDANPERDKIRSCCRSIIAEKWNPSVQVKIIEDVLRRVLKIDG
ncbi:glycosyl transferases group 1 family protein [Exiguobacterium sp. S17]|nr:glycosyl transferases group 1 family protein [Exiguobacterium sp. S17]